MNYPEEIWKKISDRKASGGIFEFQRLSSASCGADIYAAWDVVARRPAILIEAHRDFRDLILDLPRCRTFSIGQTDFVPDKREPSYITILLEEVSGRDLFGALAMDLVEHLEPLDSADKRVRIFLDRILRWQRFFQQAGPDGLTEKKQQSLWAEIHAFQEWIAAASNARRAALSWIGPESEDHDFQEHRVGVEVKSTIGHKPSVVRITSERQLDGTGLDHLFLIHVHMIKVRGGGVSLNEMVDSLRRFVGDDPVSRPRIEDQLMAAGYMDCHRKRYESLGFELTESGIYQVVPGFPRIVPGDLMDGVGRCEYDLAVSSLADYRTNIHSLSHVFGKTTDV